MIYFILFMLVLVVLQVIELRKFKVTPYLFSQEKINTSIKAVILADVHCKQFPKRNKTLVDAIKNQKPEIIFIPGDFVSCKNSKKFPISLALMEELCHIAPVYYSFGNHEMRLYEQEHVNHREFMHYLKRVQLMGAIILNNETAAIKIGSNPIVITGCNLPLEYYQKGKKTRLPQNVLNELLPNTNEDAYSILLAHNPAYMDNYVQWGADLILCGHNHGGLVRIPWFGSFISPEFQFHPQYDGGIYFFGEQKAIVSKGLGTHTFHIRIFNRAELISVQIDCSNQKQ
ncbi:MAG: metallophosphoesterase [Lachnospiraceae bacterium]